MPPCTLGPGETRCYSTVLNTSAMQRKTALKSVWGLDLLSSLSFPRFLYIFSPDISKVGHPLPSGPWEARKRPGLLRKGLSQQCWPDEGLIAGDTI